MVSGARSVACVSPDFGTTTYTREEERDIKEWKVELKEWKQGEAVVKQQIAATIPNLLFMKIWNKGTALKIWEALQGGTRTCGNPYP